MTTSFSSISQLYYICPAKNLPSILAKGILTHNEIIRQGIKREDISNPDVQQRRADKRLHNGKTLHDYVNLYLNPNNAMMSTVVFSRKFNDCVVLVIDANKLLRRDGWIITNGNAASNRTIFKTYRDVDEIEVMSLVARAKSEEIADPKETNWRQQSEFLFPDTVSPDSILNIACPNDKVQNRINAMLMSLGQQKRTTVEPDLFFRYSKYGSGVKYVFERIGLYTGDAFNAFSCDCVVISVNTIGVMATPQNALRGKGGLAGTYRLRCPAGYEKYRDLCRTKQITMGKPFLYDFMSSNAVTTSLFDEIDSESKNYIYQRYHCYFPTKHKHSDRKSDLAGIRVGLEYMIDEVKKYPITQIAMPALGCGLGGLDFPDVILPLLIHYCNKFVNSRGRRIYTNLFVPQETDYSPVINRNLRRYNECIKQNPFRA